MVSSRGPESAPVAPDPAHLTALLRAGDIDAAIEAGLMSVDPDAPHADFDPGARALIRSTRERLLAAWEARDRHRARADRLARRAAERAARRAAPSAAGVPAGASAGTSLPPAAAAALARAKARAGGA
jgi:hypothetical protein